jgi:hypothetical protein
MKRGFVILALASPAFLAGCAGDRHTARLGNYKVIYGEMGPVAQRWEILKAAAAGWEVVGATDEEECGVLLLQKRKSSND